MKQLELFEIETKGVVFKHKARGKIVTDKIWQSLTVHQKINIRNCYGNDCNTMPNYYVLDTVFELGLDLFLIVQDSFYKGFMIEVDYRKLKPN